MTAQRHETNRHAVVGADGNYYVVIEYAAERSPGPAFELMDGSAVRRIGRDRYEVVATGVMLLVAGPPAAQPDAAATARSIASSARRLSGSR